MYKKNCSDYAKLKMKSECLQVEVQKICTRFEQTGKDLARAKYCPVKSISQVWHFLTATRC